MMRARIEFVLFYLVAPVTMAVMFPPRWMFPALFALTGVGLILLAVTPGFRWRDLTAGAGRIGWRRVAAFAAVTALAGAAVLWATAPGALFGLVRTNPSLMLLIALLYPILSALPQEIVFRPLFFLRYGSLLPAAKGAQIALNAGVFSLAHLMYWSWIVAAMTFAGGLMFAWSYRVRGNFAEAVVLHSVAGVILFALGLGIYFYSGNVTRPF